MNRAARRRAAREATAAGTHPGESIVLQNPVSHHFGAFIVGNAQYCDRVVEQDSAKGQHLILCGAGPSLADTAPEWCPKGDHVWGCNSAMPWLLSQGYPCTHAFTIDQTAAMLNEWGTAPDVEYLLASTVHPHLTEFLRARGRAERMTWFHNFVGIQKPPVEYGVCRDCGAMLPNPDGAVLPCPHGDVETRVENYEDWLYLALYPGTVRAGSGLNAVNRAIDVALAMGFAKITVLGADCSLRVNRPSPNAPHGSAEHLAWLRDDVVMHADGGHALASGATPVTLSGVIDGRRYETKPDMAISAVWLEVVRRKHADVIELVGDGLPQALRDKPDAFLQRLPSLVDSQGRAVAIEV